MRAEMENLGRADEGVENRNVVIKAMLIRVLFGAGGS